MSSRNVETDGSNSRLIETSIHLLINGTVSRQHAVQIIELRRDAQLSTADGNDRIDVWSDSCPLKHHFGLVWVDNKLQFPIYEIKKVKGFLEVSRSESYKDTISRLNRLPSSR